jgi:transcriptional regulator with XRE-family HTH domain
MNSLKFLTFQLPYRIILLVSKRAVKPSSEGPRTNGGRSAIPQRLLSLHARIRSKRAELGLTGVRLAERAGISPSYVSLIETGAKVPDEDVAGALARALQDDEALYRAWARTARLGLHDLDILNRLEAISRTSAYARLVESGRDLPELEPAATQPHRRASDLASRLREVASRLTPATASDASNEAPPDRFPRARAVSRSEDTWAEPDVVRVPVLVEGADPAGSEISSPSSPAVRDQLLVDRRLFGPDQPAHLFAYEVTLGAMKHLRGLAAPGDLIVFRRGGRVAPDLICAVRKNTGIVLTRVLFKDRSLLLLPGEGERDFETLAVEDAKAMGDVIAGTHALVIRRLTTGSSSPGGSRGDSASRAREAVRSPS